MDNVVDMNYWLNSKRVQRDFERDVFDRLPNTINIVVRDMIKRANVTIRDEYRWNQVGWCVDDRFKFPSLSLSTQLRNITTPSFGIQNNVDFLGISYGYEQEKPVFINDQTYATKAILDDYLKAFPKFDNPIFFQFNYALYEAFEYSDLFSFVEFKDNPAPFIIKDDRLGVSFAMWDRDSHGWFSCVVWSDALPIILDDVALRMIG